MTITEVERQTGIRPATLRMWERRYGFPQPLRDRNGDRVYPPGQVERLLAARRLMAQGVRPGKIFAGGETVLAPSLASLANAGASDAQYQQIMDLLREYRVAELHGHLQYRLLDLGLRRFILEFLAPLTTAVGAAWASGALPVRCEHLYTQIAKSILHAKQAAVRTAGDRGPKALLATLTGEQHVLGNMMVEAVLATFEVECIQLGSDLPSGEVAAAATEAAADIVALSFSASFPRRNVARSIAALRAALPARCMLWAGGAGAPAGLPRLPGVYVFQSLDAIEPALHFWRVEHGAGAVTAQHRTAKA
ncbi:MerR family transcriptional regulator [Massilia sp. Dwa41.01b]|uniref:MerR family transcriptional regulator n=1 Tax=Massilia sp. Dwa41.01b TaxID=2709302 RepID=UPI001AEF0680|nr:MerR family transcriptional regulator [Massilia sp. Dwa41.01b]